VLYGYYRAFKKSLLPLIPSFERGENGRILHIVAPVLAVVLAEEASSSSESSGQGEGDESSGDVDDTGMVLQRVIVLHREMLSRARAALACWSMAGRRCGVVKDIRVMIAKMAWEDAGEWGEKKRRLKKRA
jgi:hypothetical protein